jgi:hypothetical protein
VMSSRARAAPTGAQLPKRQAPAIKAKSQTRLIMSHNQVLASTDNDALAIPKEQYHRDEAHLQFVAGRLMRLAASRPRAFVTSRRNQWPVYPIRPVRRQGDGCPVVPVMGSTEWYGELVADLAIGAIRGPPSAVHSAPRDGTADQAVG